MHTRWVGLALSLLCCQLAGCVEPFKGAYVQFSLSRETRSPCEVLTRYAPQISQAGLVVPKPCTGTMATDRLLYYYELWATVNSSAVARLAVFTVQQHLVHDPRNVLDYSAYELFRLEKEGVLLASGKPFLIGREIAFDALSTAEQADLKDRMALSAATYSLTSYSPTQYRSDDPRRLADNFFLGYPYQLTQPYNGAYLGTVDGSHPYGPANISGAEVRVNAALGDFDSLWITIEHQDPDRPAARPSDLVFLRGVSFKRNRGVVQVKASSDWDVNATAKFAVYSNLAEEDYD